MPGQGMSLPVAVFMVSAVPADVFDPTMRAVLAELPPRRWSRVVDLGCGPGSSTARLLRHLHVRGGSVVGLDSSPAFARAARQRVPGATFVVADAAGTLPVVVVQHPPLPGAGIDTARPSRGR